MAVAFSTGGSGYMRSDFMISDAAIPQRMEELSADQSDKFSPAATERWICTRLRRQSRTAR